MAAVAPRHVCAIDAHAGGAPLRLITSGWPAARGASMADRLRWLARHADELRRAVMTEPRGHAGMVGAVLTEPVSPDAHAGIVFMHSGGFMPVCGHGVIAAGTIALERGLITGADGTGAPLVLDVAGGRLELRTRMEDGRADAGAMRRVSEVAYRGLASLVVAPNVLVEIGNRGIRLDLAWHGGLYAILDAEVVGIPLDPSALVEMRRIAAAVLERVSRHRAVTELTGSARGPLEGVAFTAASERADLRVVCVYSDGVIDRSPSGGGAGAALAVLDAMGLVADGQAMLVEGLVGATFTARIVARTAVGDRPAVLPEIAGTAWITGEHTFVLYDDDPLRFGFST